MPRYDYSCKKCGSFTEWRSMSLAADPMACPSCGRRSARSISAPFIANMNPHTRIAHHTNEKSADQPLVASKDSKSHPTKSAARHHGHSHGHGHGHTHGHSHGPSRPWMIGH